MEKFMRFTNAVAVVVLLTSVLPAQNASHQSGGRDGGHILMHLTPASSPRSLLDLIRQSRLIVDGSVVGSLPPINTSANKRGPAIETHFIVSVNRVVYGSIPNGATTIDMAQEGGEVGSWNAEIPDDPLVRTGDRYVLFLTPDDRREVPNREGVSRYAVVGIWAGKARIYNGTVKFSTAADKELHSYDGTGVDAFMRALEHTITHPYSDATLPTHPQTK
jgi:hypothetical protein